jgi:hypothetical protein
VKNKMLIVIAGLIAALVFVGVVGATGAFAQSSGPTTTPVPNQGRGPGGGHGHFLGTAELDAAAKVLNMTADELSAALQGGKTLEQIASDKGVDFATVQAAVQAAHVTEMRDRIAQAVKDGTITQANADWLNEGLDKGYIGVPGAFGFGPGGPHGHGTGPAQQPEQQAQPTPSTSG